MSVYRFACLEFECIRVVVGMIPSAFDIGNLLLQRWEKTLWVRLFSHALLHLRFYE